MSRTARRFVVIRGLSSFGFFYHLWPDGAKAPDGTVGHRQAVGHMLRGQ